MLECKCPFCENRRAIFEVQRDAFEAYQRKIALQKDLERMGFREVAPGVFMSEEFRTFDKDDRLTLESLEKEVDAMGVHQHEDCERLEKISGDQRAYPKETDSILASHQERLDNQAELVWQLERNQTARMDRLERRQIEDAAHLTKWLEALEGRISALETRLPESTRSFAEALTEQREMDAKNRCPKGHQLWSGMGRSRFCPTCEGLDQNFQPRS